jgi:hypothetical protein
MARLLSIAIQVSGESSDLAEMYAGSLPMMATFFDRIFNIKPFLA